MLGDSEVCFLDLHFFKPHNSLFHCPNLSRAVPANYKAYYRKAKFGDNMGELFLEKCLYL